MHAHEHAHTHTPVANQEPVVFRRPMHAGREKRGGQVRVAPVSGGGRTGGGAEGARRQWPTQLTELVLVLLC